MIQSEQCFKNITKNILVYTLSAAKPAHWEGTRGATAPDPSPYPPYNTN